MATEIIMPKVDMVMDTGTFVEWLKKEGEHVEKGEPLFVVLTDKANIEIESPASGILAGLRAKPNDVIPVTEVIGYILAPGETLPGAVPAAPATATESERTASPSPASAADIEAPQAPLAAGSERVRATPAARRLAAELGIDLRNVPLGHGPRGRIQRADVEAFAAQIATKPPAPAATVAPAPVATISSITPPPSVRLPDARQKEVVMLSGPRRIIAERMAYSALSAPHIVLSVRADMSEASRLRTYVQEYFQQKIGQRVSFTAIIARAVAAVLPHHPYLNASLDGERIILWDDVHLGIATSLDDYLIVPVIRQAQNKNLEQLMTELADLVERARMRRLKPTEMSGSTFTLTNLGMFGVEWFTAIINPPETAILAAGQIVDTPVGHEGNVVLRPMMQLTLSADHRVVDGAGAARFLTEVKQVLENPYLLI
ncbi:MAG: dihydrolipoamide acetyltransferase family protein [Anaerolineae bacterium]